MQVQQGQRSNESSNHDKYSYANPLVKVAEIIARIFSIVSIVEEILATVLLTHTYTYIHSIYV